MSAKKTETSYSKSDLDLSKYLVEIRQKAFDIYLERQKNNIQGDELTDWLQAEEIIKKKYKI